MIEESTSPNSFSEDAFIVPIVVAELKFGDIQRQIFRTDLVERADYGQVRDNRPRNDIPITQGDACASAKTPYPPCLRGYPAFRRRDGWRAR